jgi:hypothetical protein
MLATPENGTPLPWEKFASLCHEKGLGRLQVVNNIDDAMPPLSYCK